MKTQDAAKLLPVHSRIRITSVDKFGFNGRDCPPQDSDIGRMCTVEEVVLDEGVEDVVAIVRAVPDGQPWRVLELVDHEIEESC